MRRPSFFLMLFAGNFLLVAAVMGTAALLSYHSLNRLHGDARETYQMQLTRLGQAAVERLWSDDASEVVPRCKALFGGTPYRVTIMASNGDVLWDDRPEGLGVEPGHTARTSPEMAEALNDPFNGRLYQAVRPDPETATPRRFVAGPIRPHEDPSGPVVGVIRTAMPAEDTAVEGRWLWWALVGTVVVTLAPALLISRLWYIPLRQATRAARRIASGNLDHPVRIGGPDELAQLAVALNDMRTSLTRQIGMIDSQRESLQTVVSNLREAVVAVDDQGRIVQLNVAAGRLFGASPAASVGCPLQECVRVPEVVDAVTEVLAEQRQQVDTQLSGQIGGRHRVVDVHAIRVRPADGDGLAALVVVRDITDLATLASVKAEFAANASHELRTPVATIRAAVDALVGLEPDDAEQLKKIRTMLDRNTRRLEDMIRDLLDLHSIESAKRDAALEPVDAASMVRGIAEHFSDALKRKGIRWDATVAPDAGVVLADRTMLQLILRNLVDNAVKFSPAGGVVECAVNRRGDGVVVSVSDTGSGIEPALQERVFERFYQVEPSRTDTGEGRGTGLGLAIAKHAAERMGAEISLISDPGVGTTVTVFFPDDRGES
ncbi:MAG: ATP-binding protein [Planctomycetota bacterium]